MQEGVRRQIEQAYQMEQHISNMGDMGNIIYTYTSKNGSLS
jgi:hypothetical protein